MNETGEPTSDQLEAGLRRLWQRVLGVPRVGADDNFFSLGDSLVAVRMIAAARRELNLPVSLELLLENPTVRGLVHSLRVQKSIASTGCLIPLRASGRLNAVYCFHAVAGTLTRYSVLAEHLSDRFDVYGLQARGLREGESPQKTIESMGAAYLEAIQASGGIEKAVLVGYSLGGLLAYEVARQSGHQGPLFLIDADAGVELQTDFGYPVRSLVRNALRLDLDIDMLLRMTTDDRAQAIWSAAVDSGALPQETGPDQVHRMLRMYDVMLDAARNYVVAPSSVDVVVLRAAAEEGLAADLGWTGLARTVTVHDVPADHYHITGEPHAATIADVIKTTVDRHGRTGVLT
ncbi:alpha/beta fold hydrolase [Catenulispora subtropica]|uniref:Carrier domain-containing protein n=1 Tax=Catenulispora subtropica TaxID=450798 RepID=A0ABN2SK83_9ACTN